MKTFKTILLILITFVFFSCGNSDSEQTSEENLFFVEINGESYAPEFVSSYITTFDTNIFISASDGNLRNVVLNFPITVNTGETLSIEDLTFIPSFDIGDDAYGGKEGSLTILSHNKETREISGTFNFIAIPFDPNINDSFEFANGSFMVTYSELEL